MKVTTLNLRRLLISLILPLAVGGLAALLSGDFGSVYAALKLPPLSPPQWIFPLVWTVLYLLMGTAAYIISSDRSHSTGDAMQFYYIQLALNFLWPILFFRFGLLAVGAFELALLLAVAVLTVIKFAGIDRTAAYIMIPYIIWLAFALYLNIGAAVLNR